MKNILIILSVLLSFSACSQPQVKQKPVYYIIHNIHTAVYDDGKTSYTIYKKIENDELNSRYFIRLDNIVFKDITTDVEYQSAIRMLEARNKFNSAKVSENIKNALESSFFITYKRL